MHSHAWRFHYFSTGFRMCILQCEPWLLGTSKSRAVLHVCSRSAKGFTMVAPLLSSKLDSESSLCHDQKRVTRMSCWRFFNSDGLRSIFRWLFGAVTPRGLSLLERLQPTPCAHGDDFSVSAPSFFSSFHGGHCSCFFPVGLVTGMNHNHKKCHWEQYENQTCDVFCEWITANCP